MKSTSTLHHKGMLLGSLALAAALAACGPQNGTPVSTAVPAPQPPVAQAPQAQVAPPPVTVAPAVVAAAPARPVASAHLGEIRSIDPIRNRPQGNGTGAVIGGVLGAVVGNQFGSGNGRKATTVLGAVGGAVAGNNVERNHREETVGYRVNVQLDNGESRTFEETQLDGLRVGDRVRVESGQLRRV